VEALGINGQEYAGKVSSAEVPPVQMASMSDTDGYNFYPKNATGTYPDVSGIVPTVEYDGRSSDPTFMSAEAATNNSVPKAEDVGYFDQFKEWLVPESSLESIRTDNKRKQAEEDLKISQEGTWFSDGLKEKQAELDAFQKEIDAKGANVNQRDVDKLGSLIKERDEIKKEYDANVTKLEEVNKPTANEIKAKEDIDSLLNPTDPIVEKKKKEAAQAISDQLANEEDIDQTVMNNEEVNQYIIDNPGKTPVDKFIDKAQELGGEALDTVGGWFMDTFKDMFSGKELARMALVYTGSRAMGYTHGASLNYGMKNYLTRVDSKAKEKQDFITKDSNLSKYTKASLEKYRITGNVSDLVSIGSSVKAPSGSIYARGFGELPTFTMSDGTTKIELGGNYLSPDHPALKGRVEKMNSEVHGDVAVTKRFSSYTDKAIAEKNVKFGLKENKSKGNPSDPRVVVNSDRIAGEANQFYRNVLRSNNVSINDAPAYQAAMQRGIDDYLEALVASNVNKSKAPISVKPYLKAQVFHPLTGISVDMTKNTTKENLNSIYSKIENGIPFKKSSDKFQRAFQNEWDGRKQVWQWLSVNEPKTVEKMKKEAVARTNKKGGWDAFTYWVSTTSDKEIDSVAKRAGLLAN
jgi:hypothetical protein